MVLHDFHICIPVPLAIHLTSTGVGKEESRNKSLLTVCDIQKRLQIYQHKDAFKKKKRKGRRFLRVFSLYSDGKLHSWKPKMCFSKELSERACTWK